MTHTSLDTKRQLGGRELRRVVYSEEQIATRVREMGRSISQAYGPEDDLLVLGLLKGSFIFLADLVREIQVPLHVDFLVASSYGTDTVSSGDVQLLYDPDASVEGRAVLLVEDIIDSGTTMNRLIPLLEERGPASLEICALLHKRLTRLVKEARWVGFDAPEEFLVGYGLDYSESFRHLPYIGSL
jgi:hypoxanthine phosphoribosyltransferase